MYRTSDGEKPLDGCPGALDCRPACRIRGAGLRAEDPMSPNRRHAMLGLLGAAAVPLVLQEAQGQGLPGSLLPTPACGDEDEPTLAQTEGPYFAPDSPQQQDFTQDAATGEHLVHGGLRLGRP